MERLRNSGLICASPLNVTRDVTVDRAFAVVRHFHGRRFVNEWNGHRWVTRVIYY